MQTQLGELKLKNPIMVASGTFGYAEEFSPYVDLKKLGAIVTKTITLEAKRGNPPPRVVETAAGMLNAIGLQNEGMDNFLENKLPYLQRIGVPIIVSIGGDSKDEYVALVKKLDKIRKISAIELNISCPNIKGKKILVSQDKSATFELVSKVRGATDKTLITKLSPNVTDITEIAKSAEDAGSDALSLINTLYGMAVDIEDKTPKLGNILGGLSGPAIKPVALYMVWKVAQVVKIPIIGMGGIMNVDDVVEFMIAGASAVCVGTGNLVDPSLSTKIISDFKEYLKKNKITNIKKIIGQIKT